MENLSLFFSKIKEINLLDRIFAWGKIKTLSYNAFLEFEKLKENTNLINSSKVEIENLKNIVENLKTDKIKLENEINNQVAKYDTQRTNFEKSYKELADKKNELQTQVDTYNAQEKSNNKQFEIKTTKLDKAIDDYNAKVDEIAEIEKQKIQYNFERQKATWRNHENETEEKVKSLAQKYTIFYHDKNKSPIDKKPDMVLEIAGEYVIFDAKSPSNEDLANFPKYVKDQAKQLKKYAEQEKVKKDLFLVVPSNTLGVIKEYAINMTDYMVFVTPMEALEPLILSLKKIEDYEFAEKLAPEERSNILRVIGKFSHSVKRKILVDNYFAEQFIEIIGKVGTDLSEDMYKEVLDFEKAELLNTPMDKRGSQIVVNKIQSKNKEIENRLNFIEDKY